MSPGVVGNYTPGVALERLLAGTGLVAHHSGKGYVLAVASGSAIETVLVTARRDPAETSYNVNTTTSSNRFGGTLRDLPQSTNVISAKVIQDEQALSVIEAVQNVSAASANLADAQGLPGFEVRGFPVTPLENGLQNPGGFTQSIDNVARIEILQGPAAVLAGPNSEGGTVNIVTKVPTSQRLLNLSAEFGSYGYRKGAVDVSGALTDDHTLSGRLIMSAASSDKNFGGYNGGSDYLVAPSLRYKNHWLDGTVGYSWTHQVVPETPYTLINPASGEPYRRPDVSIGPSDQNIAVHDSQVYYNVTANLAPWLTAVSHGSYDWTSLNLNTFALFGFDPVQGGPYVFGLQSGNIQDVATGADDTYLRAKFPIGPIQDTFVAGGNVESTSTDQFYSVQSNFYGPAFFGANAPSINILSRHNTYLPTAYTYTKAYTLSGLQYGLYFQELLEYGPLHLSASGRYDSVSSTILFPSPSNYTNTQSASQFSPSVGAVWDITHRLSLYGNYMQGFYPNYDQRTKSGGTIPNNNTTNEEVGLKADFFQKKLSLDVSAYDLTQSNLSITDPTNRNFYIAIAGEETKGVQGVLTGEILPGWNVISSIADATFKFLKPTAFDSAVPGQPELRYSFYSAYRVQSGSLAGFGIGAGIFGFSRSNADTHASYTTASGRAYVPQIPGGAQVNLNFFYSINHIEFNFGIKNVFDTRLYGASYNPDYVPLLAPRTFMVTARYRFF
jgi:iron complex outermembrane receptor protein